MDEKAQRLVHTLVGFAQRLREAGPPVGTRRVQAFLRAATALEPLTLENIYWAGRLTLVSRRQDLELYDRLFDAHFHGAASEPRRRRATAGLRLSIDGPLPPAAWRDPGDRLAETSDTPRDRAVSAASSTEVLRQKSFDEYTAADREAARALIAHLARREPLRPSRRTRPSRRRTQRPDLARTLRRSLRTHGEPLQRTWRRRRTRPRRLVLVLDVSGSMSAYAEQLARFAHAAVQAGRRHVEAFVFGTRLTRITPALYARDPDTALAALGRAVEDWEGGTRIGQSLKKLIDGWGRGGPLRGSIVVILSDGLERGQPELLAEQMRRLARLAYRIIWANPLKGSAMYQPLARGMAAALPHIDAFLAGHNLASLELLVGLIERLGLRTGARPPIH